MTKSEKLSLADFIINEAIPGKYNHTSMRFSHEKWLMIAQAIHDSVRSGRTVHAPAVTSGEST